MTDTSAPYPPLLKRLLQKLRGEDPSSAAMRESLEEVIEESERQSPALSEAERVMLSNLLNLWERHRVGDLLDAAVAESDAQVSEQGR